MNDRYRRYEQLLTDFAKHIINYSVSHGENRADADDLIQEINVALWLYIDGLRPGSTQRQTNRWLHRVMRSTYLRHLRRKLPFLSHKDLVVEPAVPTDVAREIIDELSADLDADEHTLLRMYLEGYSASEVADRLGDTPAAVRKRLQRIRQKMTEKRKEIYG